MRLSQRLVYDLQKTTLHRGQESDHAKQIQRIKRLKKKVATLERENLELKTKVEETKPTTTPDTKENKVLKEPRHSKANRSYSKTPTKEREVKRDLEKSIGEVKSSSRDPKKIVSRSSKIL